MKKENEVTEIRRSLKEAQDKVNRVCNKLIEIIEELPDNPAITRLGEKSYSISISEIAKDKNLNLSPDHYDFKAQYKAVVDKLKSVGSFEALRTLEKLVSSGSFYGLASYEKHRLHPKVILELKLLLYGRV